MLKRAPVTRAKIVPTASEFFAVCEFAEQDSAAKLLAVVGIALAHPQCEAHMRAVLVLIAWLAAVSAGAQTGASLSGRITDETGGVLPGVTVELRGAGEPLVGVTDAEGRYSFEDVSPGTYLLSMRLINFADINKRDLVVSGEPVIDDEVMRLSLSADVVVIGRRTFTNLADVKNPAEDLVGIAASASQGAITSRQLEVRPFMRQGEVLETVPGVIITQHSGEGKANQYFLRGLNLDHGSDFAMTVAGAPVNMVTHAHSQGYADLNFLIPELVAGVQYSKGPYYADLGDFATAGAANINYATQLDRPMAQLQAGSDGFGRLFVAASPKIANGHLLGAFETSTNDGPWTVPDSYRKLNGVIRYSQGDNLNGFSLTGMAYNGKWNASQAVPERAVSRGSGRPLWVHRFERSRRHLSLQRGGRMAAKLRVDADKVQAYGIGYDLTLLNNFTFYLDDPVHGDQNEQQDHRVISGVKAFQKRQSRWAGYAVENTYGVQVRNDDVSNLALIHTEQGVRLFTRTQASAIVTTAGVYGENRIEWVPWLRTTAGLRVDGSHYTVDDKLQSINSGTSSAGIVSPKGTVTLGPWHGTEVYVNAGLGFHSNNALGTTIVCGSEWESRRSRDSAGARQGSRSRRPHCRPATPAEHAFVLGARPRFGACLQRGCGRNGTGTRKRTLRHRVRELLRSQTVAGVRRGRSLVARALHRVQ